MHLELVRQPAPSLARMGTHAGSVEQFHRCRQTVAAAAQAIDGDAGFAQLANQLPDSGARHAEGGRELRPGVQAAIAEQTQESRRSRAHRGRSSQSRRARLSFPARILARLARCV